MRIALPTWDGTVSPVLDVAGALLVVEYSDDGECGRRDVPLAGLDFCRRSELICTLGLDTLICGALSRQLEIVLSGAGIKLITHVCGAVDRILESYLAGKLNERTFTMPGCGGGGRRQGSRRGCNYSNAHQMKLVNSQEVSWMPRGDGTGPMAGSGRRGGQRTAGPGGNCVCPACGRKLPHTQGQPCSQTTCPDCGKRMVRE
jgi:predicted Fe-Mo cluster-binding NifX family protein